MDVKLFGFPKTAGIHIDLRQLSWRLGISWSHFHSALQFANCVLCPAGFSIDRSQNGVDERKICIQRHGMLGVTHSKCSRSSVAGPDPAPVSLGKTGVREGILRILLNRFPEAGDCLIDISRYIEACQPTPPVQISGISTGSPGIAGTHGGLSRWRKVQVHQTCDEFYRLIARSKGIALVVS